MRGIVNLMFKGKLSSDKVLKYLMISFMVMACICMLYIMSALVFKIQPLMKDVGWDFLAFIGSIIGGLLTLLGVRITIREQRNDQFLKEVSQKVRIVHELTRELSYIVNIQAFELFDEDEFGNETRDEYSTASLHADYIVDFISILKERMPILMTSLEWNAYSVLDIKFRFLSGFNRHYQYFTDTGKGEEHTAELRMIVDEYLEKSVDIFTILSDHEHLLTKKYNEISRKVKT